MHHESQMLLPVPVWAENSPMSLLSEDITAVLRESCSADACWVGSDSEEFLRGDIADDMLLVLFTPSVSAAKRMPLSECRELSAVTDAAIWRFPVRSGILGDSRRRQKLGTAMRHLVAYSREIM